MNHRTIRSGRRDYGRDIGVSSDRSAPSWPSIDLVELNGENGLRHTAIVFHDEYLEHRALNESFELVEVFRVAMGHRIG